MVIFQARPSAISRRLVVLATAGSALALAVAARAADAPVYEPREVRLLPIYCKYTQDFRDKVPGGANPAEIQRWSQLMGGTFIHMHHYCWGLMDTYRATLFVRDPQERKSNLSNSISEFDYVISKAPPDFAYLPEMLTKKAENLILLDRGPEGVGELRRAIETRPTYWQAYGVLSDYFKDTGDPKRAREWLEKGLQAVPDNRPLTRRLNELKTTQRKKSAQGPAER